MIKFFEKHECFCAIMAIVVYLVENSFAVQNFGMNDHRTVICNTIMSLVFIGVIALLKKREYFNLRKPENASKFLYFIPLVLIGLINFANGINHEVSRYEIICHILLMINVGFLEEIVFRGFLFKMLEQESLTKAIVVSSITFGIGHIVNLLSGADLIPTLIQIGYALTLGYLFAIILVKSKSLFPCIFTHMMINSLSVFTKDGNLAGILYIIVPLIYVLYIHWSTRDLDKKSVK